MTSFFICIILLGILMVSIALVWMVIERKNVHDYRLDLDERRYELQHVIEDAEQLLGELNHFSDYIVSRMEEKQQAAEALVKVVDERLDLFEQIRDIDVMEQDKIVPKPNVRATEKPREEKKEMTPLEFGHYKGKVIPLDVKKHEVLKLYKKGVDSAEIAKMLEMGKGEIELISRMCK